MSVAVGPCDRAAIRWLLVATALTIVVAVSSTPAAAAPSTQEVCAGNLLANPAFDGGSRKTEGEGTSLSSAVADGWFPWFLRGDENVNREPEFKVEQIAIGGDPARIRSGGQSMKWFTTWATHTAGVYQRVAVPSGARLQLTGHGMTYSGEADIFDGDRKTWVTDPDKPGNYAISVGIDPTGAVPSGVGAPPPATVVWGPASMTPDQWVEVTATAVAQGPAVTVYLKGQPQWAVKHNDSFWDDICLTVVGRGQAPAPAPAVAESPAEPGSEEAADESEAAPAGPAAPAEPDASEPVGGGSAGDGSPDATAMPPRTSPPRMPWLMPPVPGETWAIRI